MHYKNIPGTDLITSAISLGTVPFGSILGQKESYELLDTYWDSGGNFIDTALIYADWIPGKKSASEKTIGKWMQDRNNRDKVIVGTKGGHPPLNKMNLPRLSRDEIHKDLNNSLQNLQTDYIDLYWLHRDDPLRSVEDILDTLNHLKMLGKIRYFGCSNWSIHRIREAMFQAKDKKIDGFVANQMMWSLASPNIEAINDKTLVLMDKKGIKFHEETFLTAVPYSSQAKGFFTKLDNNGEQMLSEHMKNLYFTKENLNLFEKLKFIESNSNYSITEIALSFLISQPFTTIPIIGSNTKEQLIESLKAVNCKLDTQTIKFLCGE